MLVNLEATVPSLLIPMEDLYYTFFADVGNVFAKSSDLNLNKMERALGFGLKYRTGWAPSASISPSTCAARRAELPDPDRLRQRLLSDQTIIVIGNRFNGCFFGLANLISMPIKPDRPSCYKK